MYIKDGIIYLENEEDCRLLWFDVSTDWSKTQICPKVKVMYSWFAYGDFNANINHWDWSNITVIISSFTYLTHFDYPVNNWNLSNVKVTDNFMYELSNFNNSVNDWDLSSLEYANKFIGKLDRFNKPITKWNLRNIRYINKVIYKLNIFNSKIANLDVTNCETVKNFISGFTPRYPRITNIKALLKHDVLNINTEDHTQTKIIINTKRKVLCT